MKSIILSLFVLAFLSCNSDSKTTETSSSKKDTIPAVKEEVKPVAEQLYSCSMHPEVVGKKDEKCSKCGMKLTVPVK